MEWEGEVIVVGRGCNGKKGGKRCLVSREGQSQNHANRSEAKDS